MSGLTIAFGVGWALVGWRSWAARRRRDVGRLYKLSVVGAFCVGGVVASLIHDLYGG